MADIGELKLNELSVDAVNELQKVQRRLILMAEERRKVFERNGDSLEQKLKALAAAEAVVEKHIGEMRALLTKAIVSLPRDWFVDEAPDELDMSDPDVLKWLKVSKFDELRDVALGIKAVEDSKN